MPKDLAHNLLNIRLIGEFRLAECDLGRLQIKVEDLEMLEASQEELIIILKETIRTLKENAKLLL